MKRTFIQTLIAIAIAILTGHAQNNLSGGANITGGVGLAGAGGGGGGSCAPQITQSVFEDYQLPVSQAPVSQGIALASLSGKAVCGAGIYAAHAGTPAAFHCELWSNADRTGTQYGANSTSTTVTTADPGTALFSVTWASPITPPGNFFLVVVAEDANTWVWRITNASGNQYGDTSAGQSGYANGGTRSPNDFAFVISAQ